MVLAVAILLLAVAVLSNPHQSLAESVQPKPEAPVAYIAYDNAGNILVEGSLGFRRDWVVVVTGDFLTLNSVPAADADCENQSEEGPSMTGTDACVLLRHPEAQTACRFPMLPIGLFYKATLSTGGVILLRLPQEHALARGWVSWMGEEQSFQEISPEELVRLQMTGARPVHDFHNSPTDILVSYCDNLSYLAVLDKRGEDSALDFAARVFVRLLEDYREANDCYPSTLCELYSGEQAVISHLPLNPYKWPESLCISSISHPRPRGGVHYIPERSGDPQTGKVIGYWLAVLGPGDTSKPTKALPAHIAMPQRARLWLEVHPEFEQVADGA